MGKEIVINTKKDQTVIAIVEDGSLAEMYMEGPENERTIGDIFLGRIRRIMPSIQAAFVDIGQKSDAFLHFSDLSENYPLLRQLITSDVPEVGASAFVMEHQGRLKRHHPRSPDQSDDYELDDEEDESSPVRGGMASASAEERHRRHSAQHRRGARGGARDRRDGDSQRKNSGPPLESHLKSGEPILVKVVKEPISSKGSRVSTDISLAGRFLVLVPMADYVAVSKKIYSFKERRRLRALAKSLLPPGFGLIVRTVAEDKSAKTLDTDLRLLLDRWRKIENKLKEKGNPPVLLHEDVSLVSSVIRDLFSDEYDKIRIDDHRLYRNIRSYVQAVAPHMAPRVDLYRGKVPIFEETKIAHSVAEAFAPRVDLPSGGYLFIEHTEAMHVIDVNSGRAGKGLTQEENSLKVNLESARAIAKQLRLRDLGGIIVVDFIDLREDKNRKKVYDELKREFRKDRAVTKILPMSDFGVVQITRQRLRPSITTQQEAPGSSPVESEPSRNGEHREVRDKPAPTPEQLTQKIERWLVNYRKRGGRGPVSLSVHPYTAAFLTKSIPSLATRWSVRFRLRVRVEGDESIKPGEFKAVAARPQQRPTGSGSPRNRSASGPGAGRGDRSQHPKSGNRRGTGERRDGSEKPVAHESSEADNATAGESRADRKGA